MTKGVFVAGHSGLVGSAINRLLQTQGQRMVIKRVRAELDLERQSKVEEFFNTVRPDECILAAAKVGGIRSNADNGAEFISRNISISFNVINSARQSGVQRLLNLGSSCMYPRLAQQPMREEYLLSGPLEPTNEPYALAKLSAWRFCQALDSRDQRFLTLIPANCYGSNDYYDLNNSHVVPALIRKLCLAKWRHAGQVDTVQRNLGVRTSEEEMSQSDSLEFLDGIGISGQACSLWGSGRARRELVHADDLAAACALMLDMPSHELKYNTYNVGSGQEAEIRQIADCIAQAVGYKGSIRFLDNGLDGVPRKVVDSHRLLELGWKTHYDWETSITKLAQAYDSSGGLGYGWRY